MRTAALQTTVALAILLAAGGAAVAQDDLPEVVRSLIETGDRHRDAGRHEEAIASYREALRLGPSAVDVYVALGALHHARGELERSLETFDAGLEIDAGHRDLNYNASVVALALERPEEALGHAERGLGTSPRDAELLMVQSAALEELGRLPEALAAAEKAAGVRHGDPRISFRLGNLHQQLGASERAVEAYREAIKKDRRMVRAHYNLGAVLYEMERYDEALAAYRVALERFEKALDRGVEVDPIHARAFLNLGAIYSRRQDWKSALEAYRRALALDDSLAEAYYNQGYVHFALGDLEAAETAYERALSLESELPLAYLHLGRIARRRGDLDEAVRWLEAGMPRFGEGAGLEALRLLADSRRDLGRLEAAEAAYREILEHDAEDLDALVALGRLLRTRGAGSEARVLLERAHGLASGRLDVTLELAGLAREAGDAATEAKYYEEVLARGGARAELWPVRLRLALVHLGEGRLAEARQHVGALADAVSGPRRSGRKGEASEPSAEERRRIVTVHGVVLAAVGDYQGARRRLREAAGFSPAEAALAALDAVEGRAAAALPALERAAAADGGTTAPVARANLGQALWLAGRGEAAREHLEASAEAFPGSPVPPAALGDLAVRQGDLRAAVDRLESAAGLCAGEGSGAAAGGASDGVFQATIGGSEDFCAWVDRRLGNALVRAALDGLGAALQERGPGELDRRLRRALALPLRASDRAVAFYVRGTAALARGDAAAARRDLAAALAGELPPELESLARTNLGAALLELGDVERARRELVAARAAGRPDAVLNLAILEDGQGSPERALEYYEEYLRTNGPRRREVEAWAERLRKIYR